MTKKMVVTSEITPEKYKTYSKFPLDVCYIKTEIVTIVVAFHKDELCYSSFVEQNNPRRTIAHIKEIFPNSEISFTLTETDPFHSKDVIKILLKGSEFCMTVWKSLLNLKYGETCSYSDIGKIIGKPSAVRSVGNAIGKNPVAYFIPCHRVVKKNGRIGGFSAVGGILLKEILLQYERDHK